MSETSAPRYPYSRMLIYGLMLFVLGWICISISLSVGHSVFWEHTRENLISLAEKGPISVQDTAAAASALRGIEIFDKELHYKAMRYMSGSRKQPMQTYTMWMRWYKQWKADYTAFGSAFRFTDSAQSDLNDHEKKLKPAYDALSRVADDYNDAFTSLHRTRSEDYKAFQRTMRELEKIYKKY